MNLPRYYSGLPCRSRVLSTELGDCIARSAVVGYLLGSKSPFLKAPSEGGKVCSLVTRYRYLGYAIDYHS